MLYVPNIKNLQKKRSAQGLSKCALSRKAGMGSNAVFRMEIGESTKVHYLSATAIAKALGCKVEDIFTPIIKGE